MKTLKLRKLVTIGLLLVTMLGGLNAVPMTAAACGGGSGSSKDQVLSGVGETGSDCNSDNLTNTISAAVTILDIVIGIAAVIMIMVSGFRYITSGGDSGRVSAAKNALIYALVGLTIAALSQFLVHYVINQSSAATLPSCASDSSLSPPACHN